MTITEGRKYRYISVKPEKCIGHIYRVRQARMEVVPTGNFLVVVEALTGPHAGQVFGCSPNNFRKRYEPVEEPETIKIAGYKPDPAKTEGVIE